MPAGKLLPSDGPCGSRQWLWPFPGYPVRRQYHFLVQHHLRCEILYVLKSDSECAWGRGTSLQKILESNSFFLFPSINFRHQHKFQTIIPCDEPYGWLMLPCKAYWHCQRTAHSHLFTWSIYRLVKDELIGSFIFWLLDSLSAVVIFPYWLKRCLIRSHHTTPKKTMYLLFNSFRYMSLTVSMN